MDSQVVELLGRNALVNELLCAGLELATPLRDRGIDLIAYVDLAAQVSNFSAAPIQIKAASKRVFSVNAKYERIANLIIVHVWHVATPENIEFYALRHSEGVAVAAKMGYTNSPSWARGDYTNTKPSPRLTELIQPYRMSREKWWPLVTGFQRKD